MNNMAPSTSGSPKHDYTVPSIPFPVVTIHYGPTTVDAPASLVYETLSDVSTWSQWNSLVPKCDILSRPSVESASPIESDRSREDTILSVGALIRFHVAMGFVPVRVFYVVNKMSSPPKKDDNTKAKSTEPTSLPAKDMYIINWRNAPTRQSWVPSWLIRFERTHEIRILDEGSCEVETWDCQAGPSAYFVKWFMHGRLEREFGNWVEGLRKYCEQEWQKRRP